MGTLRESAAAADARCNPHASIHREVKVQFGQTELGKSSGGTLLSAKITVFKGSLKLVHPSMTQGRSLKQRVRDTFVHESRHLFGGRFNPEALVRQALQGTPSQ